MSGAEIKPGPQPGVLAFNHVALMVSDLEAALPFYPEALRLNVLPRPDLGVPGAWLASGNGIDVHLIEDPNYEAPAGTHLAFRTDDIDAEVARLRSQGIEVSESRAIEGLRQAFFFDPAGNQFEFNQPV